MYVAEGLFDLGITGRDWIEETSSDVVSLGELQLLEGDAPVRSASSWRWPATRRCRRVEDLPAGRPGVDRVPRGHPALLRGEGHRRRHPPVLRRHRGQDPRHRRLHRRDHRDRSGAAGRRPPGRSTRSCSPTPSWWPTRRRYEDPDKRHAMHQIRTLLQGVLEARGKVLVKLNVGRGRPRRGDRAAAVDEVADRVEARRRRWLRGRDRRAEAGDQHPDPGARRTTAPATSSSSRSSKIVH